MYFSYFLDFESKSTDEGFKQICSDIEKFSQDFSKKYDQIERNFTDRNIDKTPEPANTYDKGEEEDESNFSSDSLEEYSFFSYGTRKSKKTVPPRRCVSNNEIYKYQEEYIGLFNLAFIASPDVFIKHFRGYSKERVILFESKLLHAGQSRKYFV